MSEITLHKNEYLFSKSFLQRLQIPTDRAFDRCCMALIEVFLVRYGHQTDVLENLLKRNMDEVDRLLTVDLTNDDFGFNFGKNPSRNFDQIEQYLNMIDVIPFILYETSAGGKVKYTKLPLINDHTVSADGKHRIVYNYRLLYHLSPKYTPELQYSRVSIRILKEIRKENVYAGILYEEGCSWWYSHNHGKAPFFDWTEKKLREKFSFNRMDFTDDMNVCESVPVKGMRIDNIKKKILEPAILVLRSFFEKGKIDFWLDLSYTNASSKMRGRPAKKNFHFTLYKRDLAVRQGKGKPSEPDLFDNYEEVTTLDLIKDFITKVFTDSGFNNRDKYISRVCAQISVRCELSPAFADDLFEKLKEKKSKNSAKGVKYIGSVIYNELEAELFSSTTDKKEENTTDWPSSRKEKIQILADNDKLINEVLTKYNSHGLTRDEVCRLIKNDFFAHCEEYNKPMVSFADAKSLLISWLPYYFKFNRSNSNNNGQQFTTDPAAYFKRKTEI